MDLNREFFPEKIFNIEFIELIKNRKTQEIIKILEDLYPADIASIIGEIEELEDKIYLITLIKDTDFIIDVFEELDTDDQEHLIINLKDKDLVTHILNDMASDDRADFFSNISETLALKLQERLLPEEKEDLKELLKYDENTAGGIMTTDFVSLKKDQKVKEALEILRKEHREAETIYINYVVDSNDLLIGVLSLRDLVLAEPDNKLEEIMEDNVISVYTFIDQEEVASIFQKYNFSALPVLERDGVLAGIITFDDILDVIEEEATEDIQKIGASLPLEESYFDTSVFELIKKRFLWLVVLLLVGTITSNILKVYDSIIAVLLPLSYFIPTITGTGGNTGTQSATMIIRSIAIGEIEFSDIFKVLRRELLIGLCMGILLALLGFMQSMFISGVIQVSLTLSIALVFTTLSSACVGGILPIIAKKLHFDPAVMSGPFISTVVDIGGLVIYFETAKIVLEIIK